MSLPMLSPLILAFTLAGTAPTPPPVDPAQVPRVDTRDLKKLFQREHHRLAAAFDHKDIDGYMAHYAAGLTFKDFDGSSRDFQAEKAFTKKFMSCVEKVKEHGHKVQRVSATRNEAHVKTLEGWSFEIVDRISMFGQEGKRHTISGEETYDETWVKNGNEWKVRATTVTARKVLVDGKPFKK